MSRKIRRYSIAGANDVIACFRKEQKRPIALFEKKISDCTNCARLIERQVLKRGQLFESDFDCTAFTDAFEKTLQNNSYPIVVECTGFKAKLKPGEKEGDIEVETRDSFIMEDF